MWGVGKLRGAGHHPLGRGGGGAVRPDHRALLETDSEAVCPGHQRSEARIESGGAPRAGAVCLQHPPGSSGGPWTSWKELPLEPGTYSETDLPEGVPGVWMRLCGAVQQGGPGPQFQKERGSGYT